MTKKIELERKSIAGNCGKNSCLQEKLFSSKFQIFTSNLSILRPDYILPVGSHALLIDISEIALVTEPFWKNTFEPETRFHVRKGSAATKRTLSDTNDIPVNCFALSAFESGHGNL
jgi:hypothetical protein